MVFYHLIIVLKIIDFCGYYTQGVHLNTSVIRMCDQRLLKHSLIEICPFEENTTKQEFCMVSYSTLPLKQDFFGTHLVNRGVWKMTPKCLVRELKYDPFSWKQARFDHRVQSKKKKKEEQPYRISLVVHVYNTSIWVPLGFYIGRTICFLL